MFVIEQLFSEVKTSAQSKLKGLFIVLYFIIVYYIIENGDISGAFISITND